MNNKRYSYYLLLLLPALLFFSCSQEEMPLEDGAAEDSGIIFRVSMPESESRSNTMTVAGSLNDGFQVTAFCPEEEASAGNVLDTYLSELPATPLEDKPGYFGIFDQTSEQCVWPSARHDKEGRLKFFAFYPSSEAMRQSAEVTSDYFGLSNNSTKSGSTIKYNYKMSKFRVSKDFSRHIDFVTATAEGTKRDNAETGLNLDFEHQLSRISLKAWGNTANEIEIAGVRIGPVITESGFDFTGIPVNYNKGDNTTTGRWIAPQSKELLEYIFREGDAVVRIGNGAHTNEDAAVSITGNGGWAMVIPEDYTGWVYKTDATNTKNGLYFSILLRVKENDINKTLVYPYLEGVNFTPTFTTDMMHVIYLSIEKATGKIVKRLYRQKPGPFFTDPDCTQAYTVPGTEEVRNYGWAAVPLSKLRWKPGYQYTYTLDYSKGIGVHDPDDPYPGKPILYNILVGVTEGSTTWPIVVNDFTSGSVVDVTHDIIVK